MSSRITRIELGTLTATRPRHAGSNARLGDHGITIRVPIVRLTTADGATGFGRARVSREQAEALLGESLDACVDSSGMVADLWLPFELPLLDLRATLRSLPVFRMIAPSGAMPDATFRVPCYDTSLYFDDLHLTDDAAAVALLVEEAEAGKARGHRHAKIKIGRGARHMELEAGTRRDIAIIRAVREALGPDARIMVDANNGYNLNLTKRVLAETADCRLHWMEEAFHEDSVLYGDLKEWLAAEGIATLIADGEGQASPTLVDWALEGLVDVIQYDIISPGVTFWRELGPRLDTAGIASGPHHYGTAYGNYVTPHLAAAIAGFAFAEWDEAPIEGIDGSGYVIADGTVTLPEAPGFGLTLDEARFTDAVTANGFSITA